MDLYKSSEITVQRLNELWEENKKIQIIDIREDTERDHAFVKGTIHMKLTEISKRHNGKFWSHNLMNLFLSEIRRITKLLLI